MNFISLLLIISFIYYYTTYYMKNIFPFFILQAAFLIIINNLQIDDSLLCTKKCYIVSDAPKHHSLDVSSFQNANIINVAFSFTNPNIFSTMFVMASFSKYYSPSEINSISFYGKKPEDYSGIMDLRSMQLGETQYINLINTANHSTLYLTVFNLDPILTVGQVNLGNARPSNIPYQIIVTQSPDYVCYPCQNQDYELDVPQYCECANCNQGFFGPHCSNQIIQLAKNKIKNVIAQGKSLTFFQIPSLSNEAQLLIKITSGSAQLFIQSIAFEGQFACSTNVNQNLPYSGKYQFTESSQKLISFYLPQSSIKTSIVMANYLPSTFNINIQLKSTEPSSESNIGLIVGLSLGSVIFIGIVIGICYILKNPTEEQLKQIEQLKNKMTQTDIQKYFPSVILGLDFDQSQQWNPQLKKQMQNKQAECVICLTPLLLQQKVKVAYCHHIFHEKCLLSWFKKQLNCPCCRYQFTKPKVLQYYQKTIQKIGIKNPNKVQLVRQLLKPSRPKLQINRDAVLQQKNQENLNIINIVKQQDEKNEYITMGTQVALTTIKNMHQISQLVMIMDD